MTAYRGVRAAAALSLAILTLEGTAAAQLVINEIDADTPGADSAEFIEILNTSGSPVGLDGWSLELINGGGTPAAYDTITLPDVELAAGGYYVVCASAASTPRCDLDVSPDSDLVQNGSPDAVVLLDGTVAIDTVSYGGTTDGFSEGTGTVDDTDTSFLGLSRSPDGADTGDNATDVGRRCITPGAASSSDSSSCPDPAAVCGNGELEGGEGCDDGDQNGTTECGCTDQCQYVDGSTPCGNTASSECDLGDICDGVGTCFANPVAAGEPCGDGSETECNQPDTCNGSGICEPNQADAGQPCGDPGESECDLADTCGEDGECHLNWFADGEPCGDQSETDCTDPDRCSSGVCSPNDAVEGQSCGDQNPGVCDRADTCDGAGGCDPNPTPAGGPCGNPTDDACTDPDTCDALGACLANDQPDGTPCSDSDFCDGDEVCVAAVCIPGDAPCDDDQVCDEATDACLAPPCGDGEVAEDEECDDGDHEDADGCTACAVDDGWVCGDDPPTDGTSDCARSCGNGVIQPHETCDDDNLEDGDGCDENCQIEPGWDCFDYEGAMVCAPMCGDGIVLAGEECDDGNLGREDGCSHCEVDRGWECDDGEPSLCDPIGDDGGCACRAGGEGGAPVLVFFAVLLALGGRRRRG